MKLEIDAPDKNIIEHLQGALVGYWAKVSRFSPHLGQSSDTVLVLNDREDDNRAYVVTTRDIRDGLALMAVKHPRHFAHIMGRAGDGYTGDVLVQLACFGELKYG